MVDLDELVPAKGAEEILLGHIPDGDLKLMRTVSMVSTMVG